MASSIELQPVSLRTSGHEKVSAWGRLILPSFSDCLFLAVLIWLFASGSGGWYGLLASGDTGFHIRTGEWVLENGRAPAIDLFSFSKQGEAWFAWEWLSDVLFALLYRVAGFKGLLLLSAVVLSGYGTILFRYMIWRRATPFAALVVTLMGFGASMIHFLARPHIFTLLGLTIALWMLDADRRKESRLIWLLVPVTALWANLHGGFLSLVACLALLTVGSLAEAIAANRLDHRALDLHASKRYGLLTLLCSAASLLTPYGWHLHRHVLTFMQSDWVRNSYQEFQSPSFRSESALQFEALLFLGLIVVLWLIQKREITAALWIIFWGHNALASARHIPIFMLVAGPWVALGLTALWESCLKDAAKNSVRSILADVSKDLARGCSRSSLWIPLTIVVFIFLPASMIRWPEDFPAIKFPVEMGAKHEARLISRRVLTMDQWANYLIYRYYPRHRVFIDGRGDFYGEEIGRHYLDLMNARPGYPAMLDRYKFEAVLAPKSWALVALLRQDSQWKLVDEDGLAVLFEKVPRGTPVGPVPLTLPVDDKGSGTGKKAQRKSNENPSSVRS
jgi:hypothetical protein